MVAKKTAEEQSEAAAEKTAAKKTTARKTTARKTTAKKTTGKKAAAGKAGAARKTSAAKKSDAAASTTEHGPAEKATAKKSAAKKSTAEKSTAKKSTTKKSTAKKAGAARAAEQTGATTVVAKKTPGTATAAKTAVPKARGAAADPGDLAVRPGEEPWTPEEVEEARGGLQSEADRLRTEIDSAERSLQGMMRDSGDGAGDDEADTGSKNITREHELALAATAREVLTQTEHALERLDAGTYGLCENCGNPIGKARMQAFPRATLCVECKQKQERRY
ncbi:TraR/DksA family transcriptional regulator [Streptomyces parvulus]|uniref:TraR/DksA family transcriptional regulator n=1 Tax=Streptomyces parvulus TaxID=146923 RepID=UPI001E573707|nr:TraR/DksA family transcriptional regulator [Streptomyces parvulus]MCC9157348.1 TraR/DksA family transcriptional regulator [Streptomyces parvulus]MCE7688861.1 TraR/DksA family transcriptional regulator [Streptomyces parvulus]